MRRMLVIAGCGLSLTTPASAVAAGGGGVPPTFGGAGASAPGGSVTYIALPTGRSTVVGRVRRTGGAIDRWRVLRGTYGVPGAAYDRSTTGLSADGRTLVLAESLTDYPPRHTRLRVLDANTLKTRFRITLPGYSTVDAISPNGRWLYVVRYTDPTRDTTKYEVRAYDLSSRRLTKQPVVDPEEPDEQMGGTPVTRTVSPDGRWAYTLYDTSEPFIHALDTSGRTAVCVDLPQLAGTDVSTVRIKLAGGGLRLERHGTPLALVDTTTFAVSRPAAPAPAPRRAIAPPKDDGGRPWALAAIPLVTLALLAAATARMRRRHRLA